MRYFQYKDFTYKSIQELHQSGGVFQKAANKVLLLISRLKLKEETTENYLKDFQLTDHGENRIKHCLKYELGGGCRLVTIQDNKICTLCFIGKHEDCERWLYTNRGMRLTVNRDYELIVARESSNITELTQRIHSDPDLSNGFLFQKIPERKYDHIIEGLPRSLQRKFENLTSIATEDEIMELCCQVGEKKRENVLFDVFSLLRESDTDGAKSRIDLFINENIKVEELSPEEIAKIIEGESFIDFENFDGEFIEHLMKTTSYQQWMLFMHPEQKKIVNKDFNGPAKLSGVSGSGKTCVMIKRALRLAKQYEDQKILILTLNKSLAQLIQELKNVAAPDRLKYNIEVKSFWQFCQELLCEYEPDNKKLYDDETWKMKEHIDEIWKEYFNCESNNSDAEVLLPVHKTLLVRKVYPQEYIRQEFDWIRSSFSPTERKNYLLTERKGRYEPLDKNYREAILKGLDSWEDKMRFVGVTDYLGLANALTKHIEKLIPSYRCILVDEEQDFGTIELKIIRKMVAEKENDIFLCGDFAQKVYSKNHSYINSGINITGRISSIKKNYRNSREILSAAYNVFKNNINEEVLRDEEYELLAPEFANYSNSKPLLLKGDSLVDELGYAVNFFHNNYELDKKCCIAICGYSLNEIKKVGKDLNLPVLDGTIGLGDGKIFLSDLEQTKGFEFDYMCIINCNEGVIPNPNIPVREYYRDLSKLYVAMTRAKVELFISYSKELSLFFDNAKEYFIDANWSEHEQSKILPDNIVIQEFAETKRDNRILKLTGKQFLYRKEAIGISVELQEKLMGLITGKSLSEDGKTKEWRNIEEALNEINIPNIAQLFGAQKTWPEFRELFQKFSG